MPPLIVANFKSHKNAEEVFSWLETVGAALAESHVEEIVVCPEYPYLQAAQDSITENNWSSFLKVGAQNISRYEEGAKTGEVAAETIKDIVSYAIIGHSERRSLFKETTEVVLEKIKQAQANNIKPIICVSEATLHEIINYPEGSIVAFEPPSAIGTGAIATADTIAKAADQILTNLPSARILYGGSVASETVRSIQTVKHISGYLVGTASLDASKFLDLIYAIRESN